MKNSKKYAFEVTQDGSEWKAQITRQVTSKKTVVSSEQAGFTSESEAQEWASAQIVEFGKALGKRNQRHSERRKKMAGVRQDRSSRRAAKTL